MTSTPSPGPSADPAGDTAGAATGAAGDAADQDRRRLVLRAVGLLLAALGVVLVGIALADLAGAFDRTIDVVDVAGLPGEVAVDDGPGLFWLLFVGVPVGLVGVAAVLFSYLGAFRPRPAALPGTCRTCGRHNLPDAAFCDTCGTRLAVAV